jgi:predicted ATPase
MRLPWPDTQLYIAQALRTESAAVQPLAQLAYQKTAGNPLYLKTFLESLDEQGWLHFKPGRGWGWDGLAIDASQAVAGAVDLLVAALSLTT